jgi:hypothetical protein
LFALERNPQPGKRAFPRFHHTVEKYTFPQVSPYEEVTNENFASDFFLTCEPLGNTIQLQGFDGCDSVEADSPIERHPGRTGKRMLTPRGEHFYLQKTLELSPELAPCRRSGVRFPYPPWPSNLLPDALAGCISRGNATLAAVGQPPPPAIAYDGQLAVNHHD